MKLSAGRLVGIRFLIGLGLLCGVTSGSVAAKPLHLLVLYADDWRHDTLQCAGHPIVQTPNLDRLASQGVRFSHNAVTTAICGVSRATLFTGQWMSRHGCEAFTMFRTPWTQTYPGVLRKQGYHVGHVGKWHNGTFPKQEFDFGRSYAGKHWYEVGGKPVHVTQRNENDALEFLQTRPSDKPFCLTVAFFATHAEDPNPAQYLPQPSSAKWYADATIPVPANATEESWKRLPPFFTPSNEGRRRWGLRFDEPHKYQTMMKNYYRLATEVDAACGKILAELDRQRLTDQTLVLFTTDNGYFHGEHGLADKWYPHQESIRVPLIVRDPRMLAERRGSVDTAMTLNVDLAPTLLAAAEAPIPATMQGADFAPLYRNPTPQRPAWRTEFFYEHATIQDESFIPASQALVRKEWKYLNWPAHDYEQLFDLQADPHEEQDLARTPAAQERLAEMRERFRQLQHSAK